MALLIVLLTALASLCAATAPSQQGPYAMQQRYHAFRFEAVGGAGVDMRHFLQEVVDASEGASAFGWVQLLPGSDETAERRLVGEVRANRPDGQALAEMLRQGPTEGAGEYRAEVLPYTDTRIRYHFSDFRVLDSSRRTCFQTPPHACSDEI